MRLKLLASVTVSKPHIRDQFTLPAHALNWWAVQKNFVRTVRAVEWLIGVNVPGYQALEGMPNAENLVERLTQASSMDTPGLFTPPVIEALKASIPMLLYIGRELEWSIDFTPCRERQQITTKLVFNCS
jgi:hypothetical protein